MKVNDIVLLCAIDLLIGIPLFPLAAVGDDAREMHLKGVKLFEESQFLEAAKAFREAQKLRPSWKLHFNVAQCEASAKRYGLALEAFEAYLVGGGDDVPEERREYVVDEIARMQPLVGRLAINGAEAGVEIVVDGEPRAMTPLTGPVRVEVGIHQLVLRKANAAILEQTIHIAGGIETAVDVAPPDGTPADVYEEQVPVVEEPPMPEPKMPGQSTPSAPADKGFPMKPIAWAGLGAGLGIAIVGTVTGALALTKSKDLAKRCPSKEYCTSDDRNLKEGTDNLALATNVLLPVGGALTVAGVVLLVLSIKKSRAHAESATVTLSPIIGPSQNGFTAGGRF